MNAGNAAVLVQRFPHRSSRHAEPHIYGYNRYQGALSLYLFRSDLRQDRCLERLWWTQTTLSQGSGAVNYMSVLALLVNVSVAAEQLLAHTKRGVLLTN